MAIHLTHVARCLESTKLLFITAEWSLSYPTFKKSANSTGFKYPGLRDSKAPACPLNSMQPVRLPSFAGPRHFSVSHLDPASHHVHSRLLSMPLGTFSSVVFFLRDVLHEREQIVSVCSSQSHTPVIRGLEVDLFPHRPLWMV
ncbi:hypothetical protein N7471_008238 [Penicillium samsonianum]|uniref:uncharacterized protein n=1 Tax=Penicillium samsonianum TaxID=1882272 RepID=UPI002548B09B|nr:uncharacterized protein N7471_008238 [Penicillium samsonianum]KAJ6133023.1 hypothetical protein N7471_008238 [Penicillium samsonianum]